MSNLVKAMMALLVFMTGMVANAAEYKAGEIIVKYKSGLRARSDMNLLYQDLGVQQVKRSGLPRAYEHLILRDNVKVEDAVAQLQQNSMVEYAQPNYVMHTFPVRTQEDAQEGPMAGGIPCIPGFEIPGCEPGGGGGGEIPCLIPGIPFPPGCKDGENPNPNPDPTPSPDRPALQPAPAEVNPPVEDPDLAQAYGLNKIGAYDAWKEWKGSKDFIVADIDTGTDYNHEDLAFNLWRNPNPSEKSDIVGFDFVHNDGLPFDDNQHGTHTAGTIGATGGNGKGISGVAQKVSIMTLKFLSGEGGGTTTDAIKAIDYAIDHGAKVISASWGGPSDDGDKALFDAIERAKNKGVLFVAAAGNDSKNNDIPGQASYPAAFDNENLIAVAATDKNDSMAFFSNYGVKTTHLGAPGAGVYSTIPGNKYAAFSGTSMACPHVSGAIALVWSKHPEWDYKKMKKVLLESTDKLPSLSGKTITGGRLNVLKALHSTD